MYNYQKKWTDDVRPLLLEVNKKVKKDVNLNKTIDELLERVPHCLAYNYDPTEYITTLYGVLSEEAYKLYMQQYFLKDEIELVIKLEKKLLDFMQSILMEYEENEEVIPQPIKDRLPNSETDLDKYNRLTPKPRIL